MREQGSLLSGRKRRRRTGKLRARLRWHLDGRGGGESAQWLAELAAAGLIDEDPAHEEPHTESAAWAWEAWSDLQHSRPVGWVPGPVPVSEVLALCGLWGWEDLDKRRFLLRAIQALDADFLRHCAKEREREAKRG